MINPHSVIATDIATYVEAAKRDAEAGSGANAKVAINQIVYYVVETDELAAAKASALAALRSDGDFDAAVDALAAAAMASEPNDDAKALLLD